MLMVELSFLIGILAGIVNGFIGGGGALITVPMLLLIGMPSYTAVSTPKLGALGVAIGSLPELWKKNYIRWKQMTCPHVVALRSALSRN